MTAIVYKSDRRCSDVAHLLSGYGAVLLITLSLVVSADDKQSETGPAGEPQTPAITLFGKPPRFNDSAWIRSFDFSADGKLMVTGLGTGTLSVWDLETGERSASLDNNKKSPDILAISPDGKLVAAGNAQHGTVRVWSLADGKLLTSFAGLPGSNPRSWNRGDMAFSPDSSTLATGGDDGKIRLWKIRSGELTREIAGHGQVVKSLKFGKDGKFLVSGSQDSTVRLWDVVSGEELNQWTAPWQSVRNIALAHESDVLAVACMHRDGLMLRNLETDTAIPVKGEDGKYVQWVAASPDGKTFAVLLSVRTTGNRFQASSEVVLRDAKTGEIKRRFDPFSGRLEKVAFSPDGRSLVTLSQYPSENRVRIWDVRTGRERYPIDSWHNASVYVPAFSPDGNTVVSVSGGQIRFWDMTTGKVKRTIHTRQRDRVVLSPDGKTIAATGIWDDTVALWNAETGERFGMLDLGQYTGLAAPVAAIAGIPRPRMSIGALSFSADGEFLCAVGFLPNKQIRLRTWRIKDQKQTAAWRIAMRPYTSVGTDGQRTGWPRSEALSRDSKTLALGTMDAVHLLDAATGRELRRITIEQGPPRHIQFSPDGTMLAAGTDNGKLYVWETESGKLLRRFVAADELCWPKLAFSPDSRRLLSCTRFIAPTKMKIWDIETGKTVMQRRTKAVPSSFVYSPDGNRLAVGTQDGGLQIWDLKKLENN